jgi:hypothetical protein
MSERLEIGHWIPGETASPEGPLARYGDTTAWGVAEAYVRAYSSPDDVVLVSFCQSAPLIREVLSTGRRVLALDFNPVGVLSLRMALAPPSRDQLLAAWTRLGDLPKTGEPLRRHLERLYATRCPRCHRPAVVEEFVWDQEWGQPVERHYRCPACGDRGSGALEETDIVALERIEGRGLAYWYLADRVASGSSSHRQTIQRLLDLYTPRNLYALAQILIKMETLPAGSSVAEALRGALPYCFDAGSALFAADAPEARPRQLRLPLRYLERNVWECLGQACERLAGHRGQVRLAPDLSSLLRAAGGGSPPLAYLQVGTLRTLSDSMDAGSVPLILVEPPRLDPTFWSLSYLWSGWLYGSRVAAALEPLLGRRPYDWEWYHQSLRGALHHAARLLRPGGDLLLLGQTSGSEQEAALLLAASGAGLTLARALGDGRGGLQLHFRREASRPVVRASAETTEPARWTGGGDLITRSVSLVERALVELLRARGEPTLVAFLRLAAAEALARQQWLSLLCAAEEPLSVLDRIWRAMEEAGTFARFDGGRWWLRVEGDAAPPLADRVEVAAYEILAGTLGITFQALLGRICERFPGSLTPEAASIAACLGSYGGELAPGYWRLAIGQDAKSHQAQAAQVARALGELGRRMGYEVQRDGASGGKRGYDFVWQEEGQIAHGFLLRWQAQVATDVLHSRPEPVARHRYLVLPETRVELVRDKMAHDPRLAERMTRGNWHFLKYGAIRRLARAEEVARHDVRRIVGLEPIIEQVEAQIPLF